MPSAYDQRAIRAAIDAALRPFVPYGMVPGTADAVIDATSDSAVMALELFCGRPGASTPRGILSVLGDQHLADTLDPDGYGHAV